MSHKLFYFSTIDKIFFSDEVEYSKHLVYLSRKLKRLHFTLQGNR